MLTLYYKFQIYIETANMPGAGPLQGHAGPQEGPLPLQGYAGPLVSCRATTEPLQGHEGPQQGPLPLQGYAGPLRSHCRATTGSRRATVGPQLVAALRRIREEYPPHISNVPFRGIYGNRRPIYFCSMERLDER